MKTPHFFACCCLALGLNTAPLPAADGAIGTLTCEFTTLPAGGKYSPRHVLAVWVTDAQGRYVATLTRLGVKKTRELNQWNQARNGDNRVDGTSGATARAHGAQKITWNCRDAEGKPLPEGAYQVHVEFTEGKGKGGTAVWPIQLGKTPNTPAIKDTPQFQKITLQYTPPKK